jgi:hypothetical protein
VHAKCLVLLVALYVSMDLSNPWMPGAFVFNPDGSIDGVYSRRDAGVVPDTVVPDVAPRIDPAQLTPVAGVPPIRPLTEWVIKLRRAHFPSHDLAPPAEDH